jgi:phenylpropionate dioxygenase-like ring-hydroxylating dioxygenase large terminal subunit
MQRHRQQSWFIVARDHEIPRPGDFKSLTLAQRPVIVVRGEDGLVRVLLNTCRHRNVTVCRQAAGNTHAFTCPDHGWVYNTKGNLVGLQGPDQSIRRSQERRGLTPVSRMAIHRGYIFVSFDLEGESLEEYLRKAQPPIDKNPLTLSLSHKGRGNP